MVIGKWSRLGFRNDWKIKISQCNVPMRIEKTKVCLCVCGLPSVSAEAHFRSECIWIQNSLHLVLHSFCFRVKQLQHIIHMNTNCPRCVCVWMCVWTDKLSFNTSFSTANSSLSSSLSVFPFPPGSHTPTDFIPSLVLISSLFFGEFFFSLTEIWRRKEKDLQQSWCLGRF